MSITLHSLTPNKGARTKKVRVGRGLGSGIGKTAGRGTKGQRSRSGGRNKLRLKGLKQMLLGFPKQRGFRSLTAKVEAVPLARLDALKEGVRIDLKTLKHAGLVSRSAQSAKLVGNGPLTKKLTFKGIRATTGAKAAVEKAGGSLI